MQTILNVFILIFAGNLFESTWGSTEFLRFTAIVGWLSNIICGLILILIGTSSVVVSLEYNLCGLSSVLMGFAVAFKQFYPDKEQSFFGRIKFTMNRLPLIILGFSLFFGLFSLFKPFLQSVVGLFVSWTYLRLFQKRPNGVVGDSSPGFAFHTMFPEALHPVLIKAERFFATLFRIPVSEQSELPVNVPRPEVPVPSAPPHAVVPAPPPAQKVNSSKYGAGHTLGDD